MDVVEHLGVSEVAMHTVFNVQFLALCSSLRVPGYHSVDVRVVVLARHFRHILWHTANEVINPRKDLALCDGQIRRQFFVTGHLAAIFQQRLHHCQLICIGHIYTSLWLGEGLALPAVFGFCLFQFRLGINHGSFIDGLLLLDDSDGDAAVCVLPNRHN